jgi:hypothetical protein
LLCLKVEANLEVQRRKEASERYFFDWKMRSEKTLLMLEADE